jgi:hypothetical protein
MLTVTLSPIVIIGIPAASAMAKPRNPGKYDKILPTLPKLPRGQQPEAAPNWQAKVALAKDKITNREAVALGEGYIWARAEKDAITAKLA